MSKCLKSVSVESIQAILRAKPEKSKAILYRQCGSSLRQACCIGNLKKSNLIGTNQRRLNICTPSFNLDWFVDILYDYVGLRSKLRFVTKCTNAEWSDESRPET
jgi:hypothetical protein